MEQLLAHLIGDYWLQNDWMALNKKKHFSTALVHATVYTLPFLFITHSTVSLLIILVSHAIIDGTNLVTRLSQLKNWNFEKCITQDSSVVKGFRPLEVLMHQLTLQDGYGDRPLFIRIWLIIIQDNTLHLLINYLALKYF